MTLRAPAPPSRPARSERPLRRFDVVVVGAGFGGLGTALRLTEGGARVLLLEALAYPGGCASTFRRAGHEFEAGATLFSGFGRGQLFDTWIRRHQLDVELDWLDPVVEFRSAHGTLEVPSRRDEFVRRLCALPDAPVERLRRFFRRQERVADVLWSVLDEPELLPPLNLRAFGAHLLRLPRYAAVAPVVGRTVADLLRRDGLDDFAPLTTFLDALCRITVQCGIDEAEAPFALSTMDYYFRGTAHVRGGIGRLAWALVGAIRDGGGTVELPCRAESLRRSGDGWRVETRRGPVEAPQVVLNLTPHAVQRLLGTEVPSLVRVADRVRTGWGACMLYRVMRPPPGFDRDAAHLELVDDATRPLVEGNHVFCSVGESRTDEAGHELRSVTISTHVDAARATTGSDAERAAYVQSVQDTMRATIRRRAPEWSESVVLELPGSPRTFERFTGRPQGWVGGIPRRSELATYLDLLPPRLPRGLSLVGDSVFPGQSTLATALGGCRTAERLLREVPSHV